MTVTEPRQAVTSDVVTIAIRPEKIRISRLGLASDPGALQAVNRLEGAIWEVSYLGGLTSYKIRLDMGATIHCSMANTARLDSDAYHASQRVVAWFTPDDCVVLEQ